MYAIYSPMENLPYDVIHIIIAYLPLEAFYQWYICCRYFYRFAKEKYAEKIQMVKIYRIDRFMFDDTMETEKDYHNKVNEYCNFISRISYDYKIVNDYELKCCTGQGIICGKIPNLLETLEKYFKYKISFIETSYYNSSVLHNDRYVHLYKARMYRYYVNIGKYDYCERIMIVYDIITGKWNIRNVYDIQCLMICINVIKDTLTEIFGNVHMTIPKHTHNYIILKDYSRKYMNDHLSEPNCWNNIYNIIYRQQKILKYQNTIKLGNTVFSLNIMDDHGNINIITKKIHGKMLNIYEKIGGNEIFLGILQYTSKMLKIISPTYRNSAKLLRIIVRYH